MRKTPRHRQPGRAVRAADRISRLAGGLTAALVAGAAASAAAIAAEAPRFSWPVDCVPGKTCYIQKYVDRDAGPGWADFACGALSNDKHTGTDIALFDYKTMQRGVAVRAAAPGRVTRTRDGVADVSVRDAGTEAIQNRECGNGVVIDHGDGWRSQYCHLRKGSIAVRNGEFVQTGDQVGLIGLSGATEYPHVHFEIRRDRTPVDPFDGAPMREACNVSAPHPLWAEPIAYSGAGIINIGFTAERPTSTGIDNGDYAETDFPKNIPELYFFVRIYGLRAGDQPEIRITAPGDRLLSKPKIPLAGKNQVRSYWWIRVPRPSDGFSAGAYRAEFRLYRGNSAAAIIDERLSATLR